MARWWRSWRCVVESFDVDAGDDGDDLLVALDQLDRGLPLLRDGGVGAVAMMVATARPRRIGVKGCEVESAAFAVSRVSSSLPR